MPRDRNVQPPPAERSEKAGRRPRGTAMRKRPLVLAVVVVLLAAWLSFLAVLAFRG